MAISERDRYRSYSPTTPAPGRTVLGVVTLNLVEERIRELIRHRRWWRQNRWADWPAERLDTDRELRALLALARRGRRLAGGMFDPAEGSPDPIDSYKAGLDRGRGYHDVQAR